MTKGIVGLLEVIDVEAQYRDFFDTIRRCEALFEALSQ